MTRQVEHVKKRRELRFCAYPGCPERTGDAYRCPRHKADHTARELARLEAKRLKADAAKGAA